jgi:hypothetical protein
MRNIARIVIEAQEKADIANYSNIVDYHSHIPNNKIVIYKMGWYNCDNEQGVALRE